MGIRYYCNNSFPVHKKAWKCFHRNVHRLNIHFSAAPVVTCVIRLFLCFWRGPCCSSLQFSVLCFLFCLSSSCVPYVASVSGLSILDYPWHYAGWTVGLAASFCSTFLLIILCCESSNLDWPLVFTNKISLHVGKSFSQHVDIKYKSSIVSIATIDLKGLFIRKGPIASLDELCAIEVRWKEN